MILDAVQVSQDGHEAPVRGLRFGGVPSTVFRDILEASEERVLHNYHVDGGTNASIDCTESEVVRVRGRVKKRGPRHAIFLGQNGAFQS